MFFQSFADFSGIKLIKVSNFVERMISMQENCKVYYHLWEPCFNVFSYEKNRMEKLKDTCTKTTWLWQILLRNTHHSQRRCKRTVFCVSFVYWNRRWFERWCFFLYPYVRECHNKNIFWRPFKLNLYILSVYAHMVFRFSGYLLKEINNF
jgi:hypothetical protein